MTTTTPVKAKAGPGPKVVEAPKTRDWSWRHGPIIGPVNGGAAVIAAGMVGDLAAVAPWWGAALGAAGAAGITARSLARQVSPLGIAYRLGCMAGAGAWLSWAYAASAWSPNLLAAAAAAVIAAGLAAPELSDHEARITGRRRKAETTAAAAAVAAGAQADRDAIADEWEERLTRVCRLGGVLVTGVAEWPERAGYSMQVRLPGGSPTWQQLAKSSDVLATDANLPHGCGVEWAPGPSKGVCVVKVAIVDTTAEPVPYPDDYSPLSMTGSLPVGMHRGAVPATIEILEDPVVIVGRQGSGKTVQVHVITLGLARCTDALIWQIDLNGAGMSRPWIQPWLDGTTTRPVVDWVAATPGEALLMLNTAIAIAKGRKGAYQALMRQVNDDKLPISAAVPGIVVLFDEGAEGVAANRGNREVATAAEILVSIGRASRTRLLITGVRATADIIPVPIQAQAGVKIWMRPEEQHETAQLLGWHSGVSIDDAPHPGSGLMRKPGTAGIRTYRGHILRPSQIEQAAVACAVVRPYLDKPSAAIGGDAYAHRWDRYRAWATTQGGDNVSVPDPTPQDTPRPAGDGVAGLAGAAGNLDDALAKLRRVREAKEAKAGPDYEDAFAKIVAGYEAADAKSAAGGIELMFGILGAAGPDGIHYEALHDQLKAAGVHVSQATLFRWLKSAEKVEGRPGVYRHVPRPS